MPYAIKALEFLHGIRAKVLKVQVRHGIRAKVLKVLHAVKAVDIKALHDIRSLRVHELILLFQICRFILQVQLRMDSRVPVPLFYPFTSYSEWKLKMISYLKRQGIYEISIGAGEESYEDPSD